MAQDVQNVIRQKRFQSLQDKDYQPWTQAKKPKFREKERFLNFCDIVLAYTQYEPTRAEVVRVKNNTSPMDSSGSTAESYTSESTSSFDDHRNCMRPGSSPGSAGADINTEDDSHDLITCFCEKPFAGRPMIECNTCLTWIHLSCAKIRRNNIPDEFVCQNCRDSQLSKRKSGRVRKSPSPTPDDPLLIRDSV